MPASPPRPAVAVPKGARGWRRWLAVGSCHWLFYLALVAVTAGVAFGGSVPRPGPVAVAVAVAAAVAVWYGYWNLRAADRLTRSAWARAVYVAGAAVGWLALMAVDRGYGLAGVVMFGQLFGYLRRWVAATVVLAIVAVTVVFGGVDGTLGGALTWRGLAWSDAAGAAVTLALVALCVYLDREVAATRAELAEAQRHAGAVGERARLAGDLHDTLTQNLSSMVMQLEAARNAYRAGDPGVAANLDQALATARSGLADVRGLVWDLRPEPLAADPLDQAIARLTDRFSAETGVDGRTVVTGKSVRLPVRTEAVVLRVVQEALANVRKHADATSVTVTLSYIGAGDTSSVVAVDVRDDGVGFDQARLRGPRRDGGMGLATMRQRVETEDGELAVESAPGEGTSVAVQLPLGQVSPGRAP